MRRRATIAGVIALAAILAPEMASAQIYFTQPSGRTQVLDPFDYYFNGPPDVQGCVKACVRDYSPCDDFFMKQTDGRCKHGRGH